VIGEINNKMAERKNLELSDLCAIVAPIIPTIYGSSVILAEGLAEHNTSKVVLASFGYLGGLGLSSIVYDYRSKVPHSLKEHNKP